MCSNSKKESSNEQLDRIKSIDLLRTIAILCVVLCHATESIYQLNAEYFSSLSFKSSCFSFFAFTIGRLGVPFFLMITGYLLLDRNYDTKKTLHFWKNNWLHLLFCTWIWFLLYDVFLLVFFEKTISL